MHTNIKTTHTFTHHFALELQPPFFLVRSALESPIELMPLCSVLCAPNQYTSHSIYSPDKDTNKRVCTARKYTDGPMKLTDGPMKLTDGTHVSLQR